jgi:KRAB domain-containing zinc finger protein
MHTDEKRRYTCPLCDKSFYQKKILRQHRKIHGERNYKCEICSRAFTENSRLREHMKVHTGMRCVLALFVTQKFTD